MATKDISDELVCKAYQEYALLHEDFVDKIIQKWTGQCEKVCDRAMERAVKRGLVDCGVSLRTGWLTPKGKEVLQAYNAK